jgi:hypothetical protein
MAENTNYHDSPTLSSLSLETKSELPFHVVYSLDKPVSLYLINSKHKTKIFLEEIDKLEILRVQTDELTSPPQSPTLGERNDLDEPFYLLIGLGEFAVCN